MTRININNLLEDSTTLAQICDNVASGGSLVALCETWQVRYCDVIRWINNDSERKKSYAQAIIDRGEWFIQRVLKELTDISFRNTKEIYNDDYTLKPMSEWPADVVAALDGIEVTEDFNGLGKPTKKVKVNLSAKLKAIEMLGKNNSMFVEKKELLHGNMDDKEFCNEFFGVKKQQGSPTTGAVKIL